ncbi:MULTISPECIES: hypothetical protein [unclassified Nodularia (in: cyanobacteria)]|uniref:hypothetical protein n=1 Tax=unclassified Nodularia (in: cyanobacteria) TaxID=2656917 RepID=UPI00187F1186|nr:MULTISPECIES: hypothetical protein [unclassified Nodularia (in: cyanobacteria)]MBE9201557.1 hypothetical protein [Nodularia sp. LEGE 06071]MCC2696085.1 hypothetical protein [Nodularia sp. LEGE 04288]
MEILFNLSLQSPFNAYANDWGSLTLPWQSKVSQFQVTVKPSVVINSGNLLK